MVVHGACVVSWWSIVACGSAPTLAALELEPASQRGALGPTAVSFDADAGDPFARGTWVARSHELVGHFRFTLRNTSDQNVERVGMAITINDRDTIVPPIPIRVADTLFVRASFEHEGPPWITESEPYHDEPRVPGRIAYIAYGKTFAPGESVMLEAILVGNSGMKLHIEAAGELANGELATSTMAHEITFMNAAVD